MKPRESFKFLLPNFFYYNFWLLTSVYRTIVVYFNLYLNYILTIKFMAKAQDARKEDKKKPQKTAKEKKAEKQEKKKSYD